MKWLSVDVRAKVTLRNACMIYFDDMTGQGSHFFGLTKFHDISMIFPGFLVNFQVFFHYF